jgi:hypothetical protein
VDDQSFGLILDEREKILAEHVQGIIHEPVEMAIATKRQVSLENDTVRTRKNAYNRLSETLFKAVVRRHGVLLPGWLLLTPGIAERLVIGSPVVAAGATLRVTPMIEGLKKQIEECQE